MEQPTLSPDRWSYCPVCGQEFEQPASRGRRRVYCSDKCKLKEFRYAQTVTKLTEEQRSTLIQMTLFSGEWRFGQLPAWPLYRCLACAQRLKPLPGEIVRGWYDWDSYRQVMCTYSRALCQQCYPTQP